MKQVKNVHEVLTDLNTQTEDLRLSKEADREIDRQAEASGSAPDIQNEGV